MFTNSRLRDSVGYEGGVSRRLFLAYSAALSSIPLLGQDSFATMNPKFQSDPFTLGVASGDPNSNSVVLWTRLAPEPLSPDGGMGLDSVNVSWRVSSDDTMQTVVASGTATATAALGHSVHVEVQGLNPDRWYWYQFSAGDAESPVGKTRTFPSIDSLPNQVRFAVTSCQNFEQGLYTAYEQMAKDDLDLVFHLGDYIYEYEAGRNGSVRTHAGNEIMSLADYRIRHAQYRSDPLLHNMHAHCPWVVTWDDHEFDNNCAGETSEETGIDPVDFLVRRANAYQAYYEAMPLRASCLPRGCDMTLYRKSSYGRLAEFLVLDTRQYRSDQPNNDKRSPLNSMALDKNQTMLGREQRNWLFGNLIASQSKWNVLAQQVMMGMVDTDKAKDDRGYSMDQWPGYVAERSALMQFLEERKISNPVVLTGDIHSNWANDLRVDDRRMEDPVIATEFVATSLSSGGNGPEKPGNLEQILRDNPCVQFHNGERGYIRCTVTPGLWKSDYMVVDDVLKPGGKTFERASFVVEANEPKVKPA